MKRLTILRPEPGASASLALAKELGIDAVALPLFRIVPLPWQTPDPARFDALLLTSANAVRYGGDELVRLRGLQVHAVGEATADAAREAGFDIASSGSAGVERLLASIQPGTKLLHLCGEDRIEPARTSHQVDRIAVYRSSLLPAQDIGAVEVVAVHSPRAARAFASLAEDQGLKRSRVAIAAISAPAAEALGSGWLKVAVAEKPDDRSLLALAKELCDKPQQQ